MLKYIKQAWLVLLLALVFGVALSGVNAGLLPRIQENEIARQRTAAMKLIDGAEAAEAMTVELDAGPATVYAVYDSDDADTRTLLGWAVAAQGNGYADVIKLMVGLNADASALTGIEVLANNETPGLGNLITTESFRRHFEGKPSYVHLQAAKGVDDPANLARDEIAALSGATISSQAVCNIIFADLTESGLVYELHRLHLQMTGRLAETQGDEPDGE